MSQQVVIDSLEFARDAKVLHGKMRAADCDRLKSQVFGQEGEIAYTLIGTRNALGKPMLQTSISGQISLQCQRCMGALSYPIDISAKLVLVEREAELGDIGQEDEEIDSIVADPQLDVAALVEEEVLLALPISPRHPVGQCQPGSHDETDSSGKKVNSAFASLAALKKPN